MLSFRPVVDASGAPQRDQAGPIDRYRYRNVSRFCERLPSLRFAPSRKAQPQQQRKLPARVLHAAGDKSLGAVVGRVGDDVIGVSGRREKIEADLTVTTIMKVGARAFPEKTESKRISLRQRIRFKNPTGTEASMGWESHIRRICVIA
jgi:hypothetical protein